MFLSFSDCKKSTVNTDIVDPSENTETGGGTSANIYYLDVGNGDTLRYSLSIPDNYTPGQAVPLILSLHYGTDDSTGVGFKYMTRMIIPALNELNAIIISPDSLYGSWDNQICEQAVLQLIEYIKSKYSIDNNRVLVTGYSMGGIGTWHFAAKYPEIFALGIPIAGKPSQESLSLWGEAPIFVIHGRLDQTFPVEEIVAIVDQLKAEGKPIEANFIDGLGHSIYTNYISYLKETISWIQANW